MLVSNIEILPSFSTSDHNLVEVEFLYSVSAEACAPQTLTKRFQWNRGDYDGLCDYLSAYDWSDIFTYNLTADSLWCSFRDVLDHALELFVPYDYVCSSSRPAKNRHRTYPRHVQKLIARKRCLWRHHKRDTTNQAMAARYKEVARECKAAMHDVELRREKRVIDADNPG